MKKLFFFRTGDNMIKISRLIHDYIQRDEEGNPAGTVRAIDDVTLDVKPGKNVMKAIRDRILSLRDKDFLYYFLFDEHL